MLHNGMFLSCLTWLNTVMKRKLCSSLSFSIPLSLECVHRNFPLLNFCKKNGSCPVDFRGGGVGCVCGGVEVEGGIGPEILVPL